MMQSGSPKTTIVTVSMAGHRKRWTEVCTAVSSVKIEVCTTIRNFVQVSFHRSVFLLGFDDKIVASALLIILRLVLRKKTTSLIIAPQFILSPPSLKHYALKFFLVATSRSIWVSYLLCQPDPKERDYGWAKSIIDLNFVDLHVLNVDEVCPPELSGLDSNIALVSAIGVHRPGKLTRLLMECFIKSAAIRERSRCGVFGIILSGIPGNIRSEFLNLGGIIVDRILTDAELLYVEKRSSLLWALYDETYDQSSGVFGHAAQIGRPCLVRRGSKLAATRERLGRTIASDPNVGAATDAINKFLSCDLKKEHPRVEYFGESLIRWKSVLSAN